MGMLSHQVDELMEIIHSSDPNLYVPKAVREKIRQAADTIKSLSAKPAAENMERSERYYIPFDWRMWTKYGEGFPLAGIKCLIHVSYEDEGAEYCAVANATYLGNGEWDIQDWIPKPFNIIRWTERELPFS